MDGRPSTAATRRIALQSFLALTLAAAAGCESTTPVEPPADPPPSAGVLGVVEVTLTGIGKGEMSSSALSAPSVAALDRLRAEGAGGGGALQLHSLQAPTNADDSGDGTIQLEPVQVGSFTEGERGAGGERLLFATYRVRNAQEDGAPYDTERENLTFLAVDTDGTIGETAVSRLDRFDGSAAEPAIAPELLPTGAVAQSSTGAVEPQFPDVLQVLTEAEADAVDAPSGVTDVFPYGFVVRNPADASSRTLPASPAAEQFDGVVTFAVRLPLQDAPSEDPFTVSMMFLATDDPETRLTQSLEEQDGASREALVDRAGALGAGALTLLPKGDAFLGLGGERVVCDVRVAGTAAGSTTTLVPSSDGEAWLVPDPAGDQSLARGARPAAARCPDIEAADASSFAVHGFQSGRPSGAYSGVGTPLVHAPGAGGAGFFPGEEVEVTLTTELGGNVPIVGRYRVEVAPAAGSFSRPAESTFPVGLRPQSVAMADLNGNGILDLATANQNSGDVSVLLGNGDGTFQAQQALAAGSDPFSVAAGDLNGNGVLDLAVANFGSNSVSVLLGNGDGTFQEHETFGVGALPMSVAVGDLNGNSVLDLAVANRNSDSVSVLLGNGDGTFQSHQTFDAGVGARSVAIGDLTGNGALDIVAANFFSDDVSVLLGNGDGTFQAQEIIAVGTSPPSVALGDLTGNGALDIAVANFDSDNVSVLLGNGDGTFQEERTIPMGMDPQAVAVGDLNGNGTLDLAVADFGSNNVSVLLGNGDGTFQTRRTFDVPPLPQSVAIGDLNGSGALDLAAVHQNDNSLSVLLNQ